jgi:putative ABC transport system permease protein
MESFLKDLKYSLRILQQSPSFTITAVVALALGMGANTAIFTVINTVILHPLPYPDSDRIVIIGRPGGGDVPEPVFTYWERNNPGFEDLAACHAGASMNMNGGDPAELVAAVTASRNYFRLFGANPILGRTFTAADDSPKGPRVLVISYGLWQRRFGGDPQIAGKAITLGGSPYAIIGVLSPRFKPYPPADVWIPLQADANSTNQAAILTVFGRLPPGVTLAQATGRMAVIGKRFAETRWGLFSDPNSQVSFMRQQITGDVRPVLLILLGAVGLVLLIACANVANLLLARAASRRKEMAIRTALGASRGRMVRQLLTESLLLAIGGGALGLVLGSWGLRALLAFMPGELPRLQEITTTPALDPRVAGFTFLLAGLTGMLFGLFPAIELARTQLGASFKESGGRAGTSRKQSRTRGALVASEVAIAVVLLCGAVLLIRSFLAMHRVNLGFQTGNLLTMEVSLAGPGYAKSSTMIASPAGLSSVRRAFPAWNRSRWLVPCLSGAAST